MKQANSGAENYSTQGFRYFNDTICGYGSCTSSSSHYHCLACGYAAIDNHDITNHRGTCPAPNFSQASNFNRNLDPPNLYHSNSPQTQECSYYPMYGLPQTTGPPTISPGSSSFYRTQPVFSPFYSANSLGYEGYGQDSWPALTRPSNLSHRDADRLASCKEGRSASKVPLPAPSSCLYSQSYSTSELYTDSPMLDSCFLGRSGQQPPAATSKGTSGSTTTSSASSQKQLPSFEPSLGFIMGPEDGMYSPAPFSFHVGSENFTEHKASPFNGVVEDLPGDTCLALPFPPAPSQRPPSCLLEPSGDDQDSDLGSDEHEIIVEETGEDQLIESKHRCVVCIGPCGWNAVELRVDHPVTLSSHVPIWTKLAEVLGVRFQSRLQPGHMLCSSCLQLLHTVDQLQDQLADATERFLRRLQEPPSDIISQCTKDPPTLELSVEKPAIDPEEITCLQPLIDETSKDEILEESQPQPPTTEPINDKENSGPVKSIYEEPKPKSVLKCEPCGRDFNSRHSLASHMKRHIKKLAHQQTPRSICEMCGKQFSNRSNLSAHRTICSGQFPHRCRTCGKGFAFETKLVVHEATHEGRFPFSCNICNKGFLKQCDLTVHKRCHSGEKPFVCEVCGKRFSSVGNYNLHSKLHDNKEKPFSCSVCKKGFMRRTNLATHMNKHSGSKPFTCTVCNKAFSDRSNLYHHKRLHEGYKPYTCPVCGKALSSGLQAHLRTHSGVRPYSCKVCGQRFTANRSLSTHMKKQHSDKSP